MSEVVKVPASVADVVGLIASNIAAYRTERGPWRKDEDLELGREWGLKLEAIAEKWEEAEADRQRRATLEEMAKKISSVIPSERVEPEGEAAQVGHVSAEPVVSGAQVEPTPKEPRGPVGLRRRDVEALMAAPKPKVVEAERIAELVEKLGKKAEPKARFVFHKSDLAGADATVPATIEEKQRLLEELADLFASDPLAYAERKKWVAKRLASPQAAVERSVKAIRDRRPKGDDDEQSQATRVVAIGLGDGVRLWHAPNEMGYASVRVDGHWENYRIKSRGFEQWLRAEYGRKNQAKVGDRWVPQVPGGAALKDGMMTLEGWARFNGYQFQPALRVGGGNGEIWLDLGRPEWNAVRITRDGWQLRERAEVPFIRTGNTLPLPVPVRGGNIRELRSVLNVRDEDFVLPVGWLLQVLNPEGSYPLIDAEGESENGKTTVCKMLLRLVDPNPTGLRKIKTPQDLLIAARNNYAIGLDNLSVMSTDMADTLCMLSTGIATGGRALYTDDEEHAFNVQRPVIFNGIAGDLTERSDLASRTIKLDIPQIAASTRRGDKELEKEFVEMWPRVLGALLDGLVGAIAGAGEIEITEPARMADFEAWAEAGCRAMGFEEWEFVDAYWANRQGSMAAAVEASMVGRAVLAMMRKNKEGFRGKMGDLHVLLNRFRGISGSEREWPKDPTRLATAIRRVNRPLLAVGIEVLTRVDLRSEGSVQHGVTIHWQKGQEA